LLIFQMNYWKCTKTNTFVKILEYFRNLMKIKYVEPRQHNMSHMSLLEPCMESIFEILYPKPSYGLPLGKPIKVKMANRRAYDQKFENRKRKSYEKSTAKFGGLGY
jgi:hypothetical protein